MRASEAKRLQNLDGEALGRVLKEKRPKFHVKHKPKRIKTVRTDSYKGFEIEIETTYAIKVNGERLGGHIELQNDGQIHYHPLPNYAWVSAVDFVRQLIDSFPDDFEPNESPKKAKYASRSAKKKKKAKSTRSKRTSKNQ